MFPNVLFERLLCLAFNDLVGSQATEICNAQWRSDSTSSTFCLLYLICMYTYFVYSLLVYPVVVVFAQVILKLINVTSQNKLQDPPWLPRAGRL